MKTCFFIGHNELWDREISLFAAVFAECMELIRDKGVDTFYLGGCGRFDKVCAEAVREIKCLKPEIKMHETDRDEETVDDSDYIIAYARHSRGAAGKILKYARSKDKAIIYL